MKKRRKKFSVDHEGDIVNGSAEEILEKDDDALNIEAPDLPNYFNNDDEINRLQFARERWK